MGSSEYTGERASSAMFVVGILWGLIDWGLLGLRGEEESGTVGGGAGRGVSTFLEEAGEETMGLFEDRIFGLRLCSLKYLIITGSYGNNLKRISGSIDSRRKEV